MQTGIIIQARTGSTRLPGKVLRPFHGSSSILDLLVERLAGNRHGMGVYIATTTQPADDAIAAHCARHGIGCYRGEEHDVLRRFIGCAQTYGLGQIVRVCADNPFLDLDLLDALVDHGQTTGADYASYILADGTPAIRTHLGFFSEYVTLDALRRVDALTQDAAAHEHVTAYVYAHPEVFSLSFLDAPPRLSHLKSVRLTVDTPDDFETAQTVYRTLLESSQTTTVDAIASVLAKHPEWMDRMARQIQLNEK